MTASATSPPAAQGGELTPAQRVALDAVIAELVQGVDRWTATPLAERAALLLETRSSTARAAAPWVRTASDIKGLDPTSSLVGEEWLSGPYAVLQALTAYAATLERLARGVSPLADLPLGTAPGGRVTIPVLPRNAAERLLLHGFRVDVWLPPGVSAVEARAGAGLGALHPRRSGGVAIVLGAGNVTAIPPLDVLYELMASNRSVLLKLHPVMAPMLSVYQAAFAPLVSFGALRIVLGGAAEGEYVANHQQISTVHITGSAATHDLVVYGAGQTGRTNKAAGRPLLKKPMTSELGGVSPVIVVPSRWSTRDLRYQAEHVATQRLHNGGYNCIAAQIVVVSSDWEQKDAFLAQLQSALDRAPARPAWYPGSDSRVADAAASYPGAAHLGPGGGRLLVEATRVNESAIETTEYFAPVLGVVEVAGTGQAFLDAAVEKVNHDLSGTLGANLIADPRVITGLGDGFQRAIARLRYGTIAINAWTAFGFLTPAASWGAAPGHPLADVQSGIGVVHNALLIEAPERTVVYGPFRPFPRSVVHGELALSPKPPWFLSARSAATTARLLTSYAAAPSWAKVPRILASAFRA